MAKRMLQIILVVIGLIATMTGLWGMITGLTDGFYEVSPSHYTQGNISPHNPAANFNDLAG